MKKLPVLIVLLAFSLNGRAQTADEGEVKNVIQTLFKGMQLGDSALVASILTRDVQFVTVAFSKDGQSVRHTENSSRSFLNAVGMPHVESWNEDIWNLKISVDGALAQAWCDYAFYIGKKFSHCGVDAFLLHREKSGWKIFHLADTRRTSPCAIPKEIEIRYK
ncbi:MAG: hypothetical protein HRU69_09485 [Flammeovirgaceae bacterium]|nr:MAG: hypothetical protein HRU69_09485 [Flammeovirgaceae bacterium]